MKIYSKIIENKYKLCEKIELKLMKIIFVLSIIIMMRITILKVKVI